MANILVKHALRLVLVLLCVPCVACALPHSRQAMPSNTDAPPSADARFVDEEDSGLLLFGFLRIAEADHYAALMARMRARYKCAALTYPQLDYFTDHWLVVAFPIVRVTAICEPERGADGRPER